MRASARYAWLGLVVFASYPLSACGRQGVTTRDAPNASVPWCLPSIPEEPRVSEETLDAAAIAAAKQDMATQPFQQVEAIRSRFASDPYFGDLWLLSASHELVVAFARSIEGVDKELAPLMAGSTWNVRAVRVQYPLTSLDQLTKELNDKLSNNQLPTDITMITGNAYLNRVVVMLANPTDAVATNLVNRLPRDARYCIDREPNAPPSPK